MRKGESVGTGEPGKSQIPGEYGLSELHKIFIPSDSAVELASGFHTSFHPIPLELVSGVPYFDSYLFF
jgi:hypothetical protein